MMETDIKQQLAQFGDWVKQHITGYEKGEAQVFLDRFFQAFGHKGVMEAGASLEMRVKKADAKGTAFADLVWKPYVLLEMKKRGENLSRHYRQTFDYWTRLVPGRPRYVILCNFDEFWVFDFETQMDIPVDKVPVSKLSEQYGALAFLLPTPEEPIFANNQEIVTRQAADCLAICFNKLLDRNIDRSQAQRFVLQMMVAFFAEDIDLLDRYTVTRVLDDCQKPSDSYDLIGNLFIEMDTPGKTPAGRFKGVGYFDGGLFAHPARLELHTDEIELLKEAAKFDWSQVRPEIFGTLFEHSLGEEERHAFGAHFTYPVDIMKIVGPTIVEPWRREIENADTLKQLRKLLDRMQHFKILDPACGSGNFLYLAYRELKRLEVSIYEKISEISKKVDPRQGVFGFVTAQNFFGIDINPFAIEIAKVTMMIGRKLAIDELHTTENTLPLDNLDANFTAGDALIDHTGKPVVWPKVDAIIGNPPFLGAKRLKPERGPDYVKAVRKAYSDIPGMADYCVYWFRKSHDSVSECTGNDKFTGRIGLVGTQNIRNNQSRVGGLDYIVKTGTIIEAVDNQPWSGEANVHVSIVNWVKSQDTRVLPMERKLWYKVAPTIESKNLRKRSGISATKDYELTFRKCQQINSALSDQIDVSVAKILSCNQGICYTGQYPRHAGFMLTDTEARAMIRSNPANQEVVWPFLVGTEMLTIGKIKRWVIDFQHKPIIEAQGYQLPFTRLKQVVLPYISEKAAIERQVTGHDTGQDQNWLQTWWQHFRPRTELISRFEGLKRFIVCSRVTKRPIFAFISTKIRPGDSLSCFVLEDDYSFGILQSRVHWVWFVAKCSKLKSDFRYTPESVFDTFPWPQSSTAKQIDVIAKAGRNIREIRSEAACRTKGGLRAVYRTLELPGRNSLRDAHAELDAAILDAYGFSANEDLLTQLLDLNIEVARCIDTSEPVTTPGIPSDYENPSRLLTSDCIRVE